MTKDDMVEMIKSGADRVLRLSGSTITMDDIDAILQKSEAKTKEFNKKLDEIGAATTFSLNAPTPPPPPKPEASKDDAALAAMQNEVSFISIIIGISTASP
jgi:hypothetical protein